MVNKAAHTATITRAPLTVTRPELLEDGRDDGFRALVHDSLAFAARLQAVRDGYARLIGISGPQYTILISIARLSKAQDVSVTTVADHLHLSGSAVTNEVTKLVRMGLVEKTEDPTDRRRVVLSITEEGRLRFRLLAPVQSQVNDVHFSRLSRKGFLELRRTMADLVESTDEALSLLDHLSGAAASAE
jgi:DNA-binding MarR family transcriptional regulator